MIYYYWKSLSLQKSFGIFFGRMADRLHIKAERKASQFRPKNLDFTCKLTSFVFIRLFNKFRPKNKP